MGSIKNSKSKILKMIDNYNLHKRIKVRYSERKKGDYSLYLDLYNNGKRQYKFLKIYLVGKPINFSEDEQKLRVAVSIRDQKEMEMLGEGNDLKLQNNFLNADFIEYGKLISKNSTNTIWRFMLEQLKEFSNNKPIQMKSIDKIFCENFKAYLIKKYPKRNTAWIYFGRFKAAIRRAVEDDILKKNYAANVSISPIEVKKEFLTIDELKILKDNPYKKFPDLSNAFLFSCFTGLRKSDILPIKFDQIREGYFYYPQKKTKTHERIKVAKTALSIIEDQRKINPNSTKVFDVVENSINFHLRKWMKVCDIDKTISFHCARHTFATMCLTRGVSLMAVSKLLGHKSIRTTMIYAKLIDKKKDEAVDMLPEL